MAYIWEIIKSVLPFLFNKGNRHEYRDDFKTAYDSLHSLTELLLKQIDKQEEKIEDLGRKLESLEQIRFLARRLQLELKKCEEAYAKCRERNEKS